MCEGTVAVYSAELVEGIRIPGSGCRPQRKLAHRTATFSSPYVTGNLWSTIDSTQQIKVTEAGTYNLLVATVCGVLEVSKLLAVIELPVAEILPSGISAICEGESLQLSSASLTQNVWSTGDTVQTIAVISEGLFKLSVSNSCGVATDSVLLSEVPSIVEAIIQSSGTLLCENQEIQLSSDNSSGNIWSTGDTTNMIAVTLPGQYILNYTNGCATAADTIVITQSQFTISATEEPEYGIGPLDVDFNGSLGENVLSYLWDFGSYGGGNEQAPLVKFEQPGSYEVYLTATDVNGCSASDTLIIKVNEASNSSLIVPDSFSPNGDGINDYFTVDAENVKEYQLTVLDRWGTVVHESQSFSPGWDGNSRQKIDCSDGTCFFVLKAVGKDSKNYEFKGELFLIR